MQRSIIIIGLLLLSFFSVSIAFAAALPKAPTINLQIQNKSNYDLIFTPLTESIPKNCVKWSFNGSDIRILKQTTKNVTGDLARCGMQYMFQVSFNLYRAGVAKEPAVTFMCSTEIGGCSSQANRFFPVTMNGGKLFFRDGDTSDPYKLIFY